MHNRHEYGGRARAGESAKLSHGNAAAGGMAEKISSCGLPLTIAAVNEQNLTIRSNYIVLLCNVQCLTWKINNGDANSDDKYNMLVPT